MRRMVSSGVRRAIPTTFAAVGPVAMPTLAGWGTAPQWAAPVTSTRSLHHYFDSSDNSMLFKKGKRKPTASSVAAGLHLYSNKLKSSDQYTEDPAFARKIAKERFGRIWAEPMARVYFTCVGFCLTVGTWFFLDYQERVHKVEGLLGPKMRTFRSRLTVVLDIDETIVSYGDKAYRMKANVAVRPYLAELLDYLTSIDCEVVVWSGGSRRYAEAVMASIDPNGNRITRLISRDGSWFSGDYWFEKNLKWLKRDLDDVVMIENRAVTSRTSNKNTILVPDFIRGEYMESGRDYPPDDKALKYVREIIQDLELTGAPVSQYLADKKNRHPELDEIPCHLAMRQMPDELAKGKFYFVAEKFSRTPTSKPRVLHTKG